MLYCIAQNNKIVLSLSSIWSEELEECFWRLKVSPLKELKERLCISRFYLLFSSSILIHHLKRLAYSILHLHLRFRFSIYILNRFWIFSSVWGSYLFFDSNFWLGLRIWFEVWFKALAMFEFEFLVSIVLNAHFLNVDWLGNLRSIEVGIEGCPPTIWSNALLSFCLYLLLSLIWFWSLSS